MLLRDPDLSLLQSGTLEKVKEEFYRVLGNGRDSEDELNEKDATEEPKSTAEAAEDEEPTEDDLGKQLIDEEIILNATDVNNVKGFGNDLGRKKHILLTPNLPLDWNKHLKPLNHADCTKDDYPDLSLNIGDRLRLKNIRRME